MMSGLVMAQSQFTLIKKAQNTHYTPVLIFKYINIFSDWWIMPDDIPDENTVNQLRPKRKDALGMTLKVNRKCKF